MSDEKRPPPVYLNVDTVVAELAPKSKDGDGDEPRLVFASDDALARQLVGELGDDWRCARPPGDWYRWTGAVWERDAMMAVVERARLTCSEVAKDIEKHSLARSVCSNATIFAVVRLGGADPRCVVSPEIFDRDDWLLNTPACTVDLRTGQARCHRREDYCARSTRVSPEGECPTFDAFLLEATGGDEALSRFVQRAAGYCLTGVTKEHAIFFLEGPGGTGKTILLNILQWILGDYATAAPMDVFTVSTGERHPADLALLHGARLVTASETEEGRRWDEAKLKAITGGDPITARRIRQDFFTFVPKFKLFMAGNYRPAMRSADDAMRRRFHVIPWKVKPARSDKELLEKLQREAGGILKWAIEGAAHWQRHGLGVPEAVVRSTDEYFEAENVIGRWIAERCLKEPNETATIKTLFQDFKSWAATTGEFVGTERRFAQRLERAGFDRWREPGTGQKGFRGVAPLVRQSELGIASGGRRQQPTQETLDDPDEWERRGPRD